MFKRKIDRGLLILLLLQLMIMLLLTIPFKANAGGQDSTDNKKDQDVTAILAELGVSTQVSPLKVYPTIELTQHEELEIKLENMKGTDYRLHIYTEAGEDVTMIQFLNNGNNTSDKLSKGFYFYKLVGNGDIYAGTFLAH